MNKIQDAADSDNLMMTSWPAIFSSGINTHMPNRAAMAGLGWMTVFLHCDVFPVNCQGKGRCSHPMWEDQLQNNNM